MLMRTEYLLLPANRAFITFTLLGAFVLNLLPWGRIPWMPDFLAVVLVFWNIHQPRKVGIGIAFLFGILMDVHDSSRLGEHALAYSIISYGAIAMHRRVPFFGASGQMVHLLPLFIVSRLALLLVRMAMGAPSPGWAFFYPALTSTLLWPIADWLLLAPQRRAIERDENRPI
jgi:rod shape-determining protein MreD